MAFISQIGKKSSGAKPSRRMLHIRKTASGATGGMISEDTGLRDRKIDIQIDEESRILRVREADNGVKVHSKGTFSCSICVFKITGKQKIGLTQREDGWWYGNY